MIAEFRGHHAQFPSELLEGETNYVWCTRNFPPSRFSLGFRIQQMTAVSLSEYQKAGRQSQEGPYPR